MQLVHDMTYAETIDGPWGPTTGSPLGSSSPAGAAAHPVTEDASGARSSNTDSGAVPIWQWMQGTPGGPGPTAPQAGRPPARPRIIRSPPHGPF
jgi:hypothetical protein